MIYFSIGVSLATKSSGILNKLQMLDTCLISIHTKFLFLKGFLAAVFDLFFKHLDGDFQDWGRLRLFSINRLITGGNTGDG
ncbi:hypothetical protein [Bacillus salipaludis]|uniref:Uncharacterized protein n=1 Tax=Bacillus salipaludis TaxID=2547811 RepID=A0ABW8RNQ6_9BACI